VLHAARCKYRTQKNRHFGTIAQVCRAISSELRHVSTIGKKLLNSNTSCTCPDNMVNFGLLTAENCWRVWGTPTNFNGFRVLAALLYGTSSGRQPNFAALNRGRHLCSAGRPSRWALAHILVLFVFCLLVTHISRERLNGFAPNSQGRRAWSLARSNLKVNVKGQRSRLSGTTQRCALRSPPAATEWNALAANDVTQQRMAPFRRCRDGGNFGCLRAVYVW